MIAVMGQRIEGINIVEENRATVWMSLDDGVAELRMYMNKNYLLKGVKAILAGVHKGDGLVSYAVFVEDGFLRHTEPE
jgi:hypothetical protein